MSLPQLLADFPSATPVVTVVFRGLLTFCFNNNRCEVGRLNEFEPGQDHEFVFRKWVRSSAGNCLSTTVYPTPTSSFELRVNGALPDVDGLFIIGRDPFNRDPSADHTNDFRWMIDFESDIYPGETVTKTSSKVHPRLSINKGVFYTYHRTLTRFNAHHAQGVPVRKLTSVAEVMAARIYLTPDGSVEVFENNNPSPIDTLTPTAGQQFQIDVFNLCPNCNYKPGHPSDHKQRNDFFTYYKAVQKPTSEQFHLIAAHPTEKSKIPDLCPLDEETGTDPAPCGPIGFGRSDSFD